MLRVALTGGIASGKSSAAAAFRELGVPVIDSDRIAREVVEPGAPGLHALIGAFGRSILTDRGTLDRERLRRKIFSDRAAREQVNALLHPLIVERIEAELRELAGAPYAIVEIPLLAETGIGRDFDRVVVVDLPEDEQRRRLERRDGASPDEARAALAAQASREERLALADDVLDNSGSLEQLRTQVSELHARYLRNAKRFASRAERPAE